MRVSDVKYIGSFGYAQEFPQPAGPEFVFLGRSNVGKSSLINRLLGRKSVARTSNTPGKTRTANFYEINEGLRFVDVPGYGYAKVSRVERARWTKLIAQYLESRATLRGVIHLLDARHPPSADDRKTTERLAGSHRPVCIVFNKIDKLKPGLVDRRIAEHLQHLRATRDTAVVPFSAVSGAGARQ